MADTDYAGDFVLLANTPAKAKSLLYALEQAVDDIGLHMNANKTKFMCFKQEGASFILNCWPLKLVDKFTYLSSNISTQNNVNTCLAKAWTAIDW